MERTNAWNTYDMEMQRACMDLAEDYKAFLDQGKTERECIDTFVNEAEANGYIELSEAIREGKRLSAGDRVYSVWMNKSIVLFEIGSEPFENGINILGAHIDSPRLDVKQNPMYEDSDIAYILRVGEDDDDPVFFISDLLIHLSQEQLKKPAATVVEGEALDLIIGSRPIVIDKGSKDNKDKKDSAKEAVKKSVLKILSENYDIDEEDFESAELEIVPAGRARDAGFDRSMILGYGQDDRACAYPSFRAQVESHDLKRCSCTLLVDKEEIGSVGATGMRSRFFENALAEVMNLCGQYSELALRRTLANSCMLSSDVSAAFDPSYASAFEKKNAAYLGKGMTFHKYTGSRGKGGSNDANAEYIAHLRGILGTEKICTQTAELGRVDLGGGGTIAYILALYGMNVIDCGVPVLSMHSPWEAISKADLYETYRGYKVFLREASLTND